MSYAGLNKFWLITSDIGNALLDTVTRVNNMLIDNDEVRKLIDRFFSHNYDLRLHDSDITHVIDFINELLYEQEYKL